MTKKLDVDKHVGPAFTVVILALGDAFIMYHQPVVALVFAVLVVVVTLPWWFTALWNKYIATEDGYYD